MPNKPSEPMTPRQLTNKCYLHDDDGCALTTSLEWYAVCYTRLQAAEKVVEAVRQSLDRCGYAELEENLYDALAQYDKQKEGE